MGADDEEMNENPIHPVEVPAFKIMTTEVTQRQWQAVKGNQPSKFTACGGDCPVESVSWNDVQDFIKKLNQKSGKIFRLPSESEWEYAARAVSTTEYSWGDDIGKNRATCDGCVSQWDNKQTAPVASFKPNAFGLYDMHGNVWEWTQDCLSYSYGAGPDDGRALEEGECDYAILRGGAWFRIHHCFVRPSVVGMVEGMVMPATAFVSFKDYEECESKVNPLSVRCLLSSNLTHNLAPKTASTKINYSHTVQIDGY